MSLCLDALELIWIRMPLVGRFEISRGAMSERHMLLVRARAGDLEGWGEAGVDRLPFYSYETVGTCWHVIEEFLAPDVLGMELPEHEAPREVARRMAHWPWHPMAKAVIEEAVWDLEARRQGVPVHRLYAGDRPVRDRIEVGISLGIQEDFEVLAAQIANGLQQGYRRIKLKVAPGRDIGVVSRVRERFGDIPLMVDANCGYSREQTPALIELDAFGLLMIEQPYEYDDIDAHVELRRLIRTPICLDESAKTVEITTRALDRGAADIINIKCSRLGGRAAGIDVHDLCAARGIPVWCGGMLESGIGRLHNIAIATLPNFSMSNDLSASRRYWERDIIDPEVTLQSDGTVAVPQTPGIGHRVSEERIAETEVRRATLRA